MTDDATPPLAREVFSQTVATIDLQAIFAAVNPTVKKTRRRSAKVLNIGKEEKAS